MITYQVRVECQYQASTGMEYSFNIIETPDKHDKYGDRFISGLFSLFLRLFSISSFLAWLSIPTFFSYYFSFYVQIRPDKNFRDRKQNIDITQDFIRGGHFYARVSIFSEDKSSLTEIKQRYSFFPSSFPTIY